MSVSRITLPEGLKPVLILKPLTARLKSCPFKTATPRTLYRFAKLSLGVVNTTLGFSARVTVASTLFLRAPRRTSFSVSTTAPPESSASVSQRSKRARSAGIVPAPATAPCSHSKCSVPFAEEAKSSPVKPERSTLPLALKFHPTSASQQKAQRRGVDLFEFVR